MENNRTKGVIYYKLEDRYDGDITKYCGLSAGEIDSNMFFLRGYDIQDVKWDADQRHLRFVRVNGDDIIVTGIDVPISMEKSYYDSVDGILYLNINGVDYAIKGFGVYTGETVKGNGAINNPIEVTDTLRTGFFAPVESFIDLTNIENKLPESPEYGARFLTKEKINPYGMLFNASGIEKVKNILKNNSSPWRIPTDEEWGEMLNALEDENHRTHITDQSNNFNGKLAGAILKKGSYKWELVEVTNESIETSIKITNNLLPNPSYIDFFNSLTTTYEIEVVNDNVKKYEQYKCVDVWLKSDKVTPSTLVDDEFGFSVPPAGFADGLNFTNKLSYGKWAGYWSDTEDKNSDIWAREFKYDEDGVLRQAEGRGTFLSIRLVRDYIGTVGSVEFIDGLPYKTILMPYVKLDEYGNVIGEGRKVWMASNLSIPSILPNNASNEPISAIFVNNENGDEVPSSEVYFINFWNGFSWEKRAFNNNDMVIINNGPDKSFNEEWQLLNGILVRRSNEIIDAIGEYAKNLIDELDEKHDDDVNKINDTLSHLTSTLDNEIIERKNDYNDLISKLNDEIKSREDNDIVLHDKLVINHKDGAVLSSFGGQEMRIYFDPNFGEIDIDIFDGDCNTDDCLYDACISYGDGDEGCVCDCDLDCQCEIYGDCGCEGDSDYCDYDGCACEIDNGYYTQLYSLLSR